jgi:hypothetical protein
MRISFEAELTVLTALTAYCALVYTLIALYVVCTGRMFSDSPVDGVRRHCENAGGGVRGAAWEPQHVAV